MISLFTRTTAEPPKIGVTKLVALAKAMVVTLALIDEERVLEAKTISFCNPRTHPVKDVAVTPE
jgi:hypothetical protein